MSINCIKYILYGCIVGGMVRKIWNRTHEESKINLREERPVPPPPALSLDLSPADSYQDIRPVGYGYARRPVYRATDLAVAGYTPENKDGRIMFNGKVFSSAAELFQAMEQETLYSKETSIITPAEE